jgi:hypothetical protein
MENINKTKSKFFEKINKIHKLLVRLRKKETGHKLLISETKGGCHYMFPGH